MSWMVEVNTFGDPETTFTGNGLRFKTQEEAKSYAADLAFRWTAVRTYRVIESGDLVNYEFKNGGAYALSDSE